MTGLPAECRTRELDGLVIGHLGHFDPAYSRNRMMAKALKRAGAEVIELVDRRGFARRTPSLARRTLGTPLDLILVGFPGHADVVTAKAVGTAKRAPVIFDAFVSASETAEDRGAGRDTGIRRLRYGVDDRLACRFADLVLLDTQAHMDYFTQRFGLAGRKLRRVWVGTDDEIMTPRPRVEDGRFHVLFCGTYIPLHGVETILRACRLLERAGDQVDVTLVGSGQTYTAMRDLASQLGLRSLRFLPRVPYQQLPDLIAQSDVYLGIFGDSPKAARVIPNKVFDGLAMARPVVTADTPAAREALEHGRHAWLVPAADPEALADAIRLLRADPSLRQALASEGHALFRREFSIDVLSATMSGIVRELVP